MCFIWIVANPDELDDIAPGWYKNAQWVPFLPKARGQLIFTNWLQSQGCVRKRQSCHSVHLSPKRMYSGSEFKEPRNNHHKPLFMLSRELSKIRSNKKMFTQLCAGIFFSNTWKRCLFSKQISLCFAEYIEHKSQAPQNVLSATMINSDINFFFLQ